MENNKRCYYFKKIRYNRGIFDNIIDACFVLLMENSKERKITITNTINKFKLSNNTIIQYNKGYKKCSKKLYKQNSAHDLNDAYYNAFKYADSHNYKNILILEDDAMFDHNILNPKIIRDIENLYKSTKVNLFNLGPALFLLNPKYLLFDKHNCKKVLCLYTTHANIYSREYRKIYYKKYNNVRKIGFDEDINSFNYGPIYIYNKPLSYQPFIATENNANWKFMGIKTGKISLFFMDKIFRLDFKNEIIKSYKKLSKIIFLHNLLVYLIIFFILYKICIFVIKKY